MSKTNRKRQDDMALSKNNGQSIRYIRRRIEEEEASLEQRKALDEFNKIENELFGTIPNDKR